MTVTSGLHRQKDKERQKRKEIDVRVNNEPSFSFSVFAAMVYKTSGKGVGGEKGEGNVVNPEPDTQAIT